MATISLEMVAEFLARSATSLNDILTVCITMPTPAATELFRVKNKFVFSSRRLREKLFIFHIQFSHFSVSAITVIPTLMLIKEMSSAVSDSIESGAAKEPAAEQTDTPIQQLRSASRDRVSGPTACVCCRNKHLKCDGLPVCSRCLAEGKDCVYVKSRRGHRGFGKQIVSLKSPSQSTQNQHPTASKSSDTSSTLQDFQSTISLFPASNFGTNNSESLQKGTSDALHSRCIEAFFHYFYDSHPFLPPRNELLQFLQINDLPHLELSILYIGSQHVAPAATSIFGHQLETYFRQDNNSKDWSMVQSLILYALGRDRNGDQGIAAKSLTEARNLALALGMNHSEYAMLNGRGSPICEESLRRTWWELYIVSIMFAGFHGKTSSGWDGYIVSSLPLPCEERGFACGFIPPLHTIEEFEEDSFSKIQISWSSYTYRIIAARNLQMILDEQQSNVFPDDPGLFRKEAYLTNWNLHLPEPKKSFFQQDGTFDEMIFQAHLIYYMSELLLHRHYSKRDEAVTNDMISYSDEALSIFGIEVSNLNALKTRQAASKITQLISVPIPLIKHTHFFMCGITFASTVHLCTWSALPPSSQDDEELKQEIRMGTGALKEISRVWGGAQLVLGQLTAVARKIYQEKKSPVDQLIWQEFMDEETLRELC
ncbi:hypothetical protein G7Y89_g5163 [Cudoniella acicularis]|uniref:Zn(2)-C6 fungal-type domain-containing protein n=1 Tax=Cudoniella acicularis TaxID=354080 RepID=A0A8H4RN00_9HELO|nr:hypothetical protein G7Y89_g5163 [Cudoniella acicularis]